MALSITGSKRWPKWKVLQKFAKQHCALGNSKIDQAIDEVHYARNLVLPLFEELSDEYPSFGDIAEKMVFVMHTPF